MLNFKSEILDDKVAQWIGAMPGIIVNLGHPGLIRTGAGKMSRDDLPADPASGFENRDIAFSSGFCLKMPGGEQPAWAAANYRHPDFLLFLSREYTILLSVITLSPHKSSPLVRLERIDITHRNSPNALL